MRLWHLFLGIGILAVTLTVARDPVGLVALIVFWTMVGEVVLGTTSLMMLFQTVGAFGEAEGLFAHVEAAVATLIVLTAATALMCGWLFVGLALMLWAAG